MMTLEEISTRLERRFALESRESDVLLGLQPRVAEPRRAIVEREVRAMRRKHPELRTRITFRLLQSLFRKENIFLFRAKMSSPGRAIPPITGTSGIILRKPMPERGLLVPVALHELGHVRLHIFDTGRAERMREELNATSPIFTLYDQSETEADLFRDLILTVTPTTRRSA